jgi:hypothetical protein
MSTRASCISFLRTSGEPLIRVEVALQERQRPVTLAELAQAARL